MKVSDGLMIYQVLSSISGEKYSYAAKYKAAQNRAALQPVADFSNTQLEILKKPILDAIDPTITEPKKRQEEFDKVWFKSDIQEKALPIVNAEITVNFIPFLDEELQDSPIGGGELEIFLRFGLLVPSEIISPAVVNYQPPVAS